MGPSKEGRTAENGSLLALVAKGYTRIGVDRVSVYHVDCCIVLSMDE